MLDNTMRRGRTDPCRPMGTRQVWSEYQRIQNTATEYERKHVYRIECRECNAVLTDRGMNVRKRGFMQAGFEIGMAQLFSFGIGCATFR
jgi:hypothetical protein